MDTPEQVLTPTVWRVGWIARKAAGLPNPEPASEQHGINLEMQNLWVPPDMVRPLMEALQRSQRPAVTEMVGRLLERIQTN